jgi:SAM-dependent MidA family methyltransferase
LSGHPLDDLCESSRVRYLRGRGHEPAESILRRVKKVEERLKERIRSRGRIPFAEFMDTALYGSDGYYDAPRLEIGPVGDFVTGSSASPHFGRATARLLESLDAELGKPAHYLEAGYGGGEHLAAVLSGLERDDRRAEERRMLAWDRIERPVPEGIAAMSSLEEIGEGSLDGLVFSYELFDALAVHRLVRRGEKFRELWVGEMDGEFSWREDELTDDRLLLWNLDQLLEGQVVDVTLAWGELYSELARRLGRGLVVSCDYGFTRERLVDPRVRMYGTLACYRRHRVHRNPFVNVGEQDLTAHVDFSSLIAAGEAAGLETVGLFRQAEWLAANGLLEDMGRRTAEERIEIMELMNPEGMGEEIRVLVQARGVDATKVLPLLI